MLNDIIVKIVRLMPKSLVRVFANRYIAGDSLDDAVKLVKELNSDGIMATMDVLGEAITSKVEAVEAQTKAMEVLKAISANSLNSNLSIKPTQFGLMIDEEFCYKLVKELVEYATTINNFVRLDMEDSDTTDKIIALYTRLRKEYSNVGIVIQAYLRRSFADAEKLNALDTNYRLCKGIYREHESIAFHSKEEIRKNYMKVVEAMLTEGKFVGIATHDDTLIDASRQLIIDKNIDDGKYEFQMLLGVREDLRRQIRKNNEKLRIYVPFGKDWYAYSIRRLKENPNMAMDITKNIFRIH